MSSRALRKARKEREQLELQQNVEEEEASEDDSPVRRAKPSAFEMLGDQQEDEDGDEGEGDDDDEEDISMIKQEGTDVGEDAKPKVQAPAPAKRKKKKKKKTKQSRVHDDEVDEIDAALDNLSAGDTKRSEVSSYNQRIANEPFATLNAALAVDPYHLQVANEMRRVFGRAAFTADQEERADNRRRLAEGDHASLAEAVTGRLAHGGPGLPAVLRRRNLFVQGKEEWPRNTSNGLTMEIERSDPVGVTTYKFVHTQPYKISQLTFAQCQATMDPSNMVNMLRFYPYHVATLLQVSEIAKQERDNATAGELLERALFAFGKALHPTFASALSEGKARLDFRRPENREFYLAAFRYIVNIGLRATWRTAYEWSRLLLALDPIQDPYCMRLVIDQLALRAHQAKSFLELSDSRFFRNTWGNLSNINYSKALAQHMLDSNSGTGAEMLKKAVLRYPWVAGRLFQQLGISKLPPSVWGKAATSPKDILHTELYVTLASDVWRLPDALTLLKNTVSAIPSQATEDRGEHSSEAIDMNEARYVILTDKPTLIGLIPRELTNKVDSMSDPLRPDDSVDEHDSARLGMNRGNETPEALLARHPQGFMEELVSLQQYFEGLVPGLGQTEGASDAGAEEIPDDAIDRAINESGQGIAEMRTRLRRLLGLRNTLVAQPGGRVASDGAELRMGENGLATLTSGEGTTLFGLSGEQAARVEREIEEEMVALQAQGRREEDEEDDEENDDNDDAE